jgi:5-methylcytosine-specific restriction endonuclease McrA
MESNLTHFKRRTGHDSHIIRRETFERDNYTCVKCGHIPFNNGMGVYKDFEDYLNDVKTKWGGKQHPNYIDQGSLVCDHIIPICMGGNEYDLNNTQTLCLLCDLKKSSQDISDGVWDYMQHKKKQIQTNVWHFKNKEKSWGYQNLKY